ncbi:hypothetical protein CRE_01397 [Caenorhabditis remanei]|uniref:Uncharacterized protein n=1 Tax=Caenorhabditis remanei TaxID=31234 RepID=E3NHV4_CAERE|nr:hypothetical protein CRE_01397 [Caenorhabditis remanei]
MTSSQISPLAFQRQQNRHQSKSTLSVPNRANLRETKSINRETLPLRSAPLHGTSSGGGQLSPRSNDYYEFGKYTNALRSATDEIALPHRKLTVKPRPSSASWNILRRICRDRRAESSIKDKEDNTSCLEVPERYHKNRRRQLSPPSNDYFEFGQYTNALRSATDEFALPHRKVSVEPRPSVAII